MWRSFLEDLNCEVVVSPNTNKAIMDTGENYSIDESCTSAKIFMGHVSWLIGKCDYILIPRIESYANGDTVCTKFYALYDICRSTFPEAKFICYNVDYAHHQTEWKAYKQLGEALGASVFHTRRAYLNAKNELTVYEKILQSNQDDLIHSDNLKVLIVSHPYNIYDEMLGTPIIRFLKDLNVDVFFADIPDSADMCAKSKHLSRSMYWHYNKEIVGSISHYESIIDGIIFLTTFPCGPDSLTVELLLRKIKGIPMTNLVVDSNTGEAGLHTRIESFIDIIAEKKKRGDEYVG
jgi:predicted nucleotide-binding protein (sugar kinase/HSP70/actin superfamily)